MQTRSLTVWLPKYAVAQQFLRIMDGTTQSKYWSMWNDITSQAGTKQNNVNWKDPEVWIPERLHGDSRALAFRLWRESGKLINPRWSYEILRFVISKGLAELDDGSFIQSERGKCFISEDEAVVKEIDDKEGVIFLLNAIADRGPGTRKDFIDVYTRLCRSHTTWTDNSIANSFSTRVNNLADRSLITTKGHTYQISDAGLTYLQHVSGTDMKSAPAIEMLVSKKNLTARQELTEDLQEMNPYAFEHLIKRLLDDMGYDNVEVTAASNDKGVDVVADIELGISRVREVIQVKRQKGTVGRPILDLLRGSLYRFDAVRGTVITTGGFAKGAKNAAFDKKAAPITLIDGERLLDLLIEHDIGIRRREIRILEFDGEALSQFEAEVGSDGQ